MKITKRQLQRIIKEEKQKLREERHGIAGHHRARVNLVQATEEYTDLVGLEAAIGQLQLLLRDLEEELERSLMDEEF